MNMVPRLKRTALFLSLLTACFVLRASVVKLTCSPQSVMAVQGEKIMLQFSLRNGSAYTLSQARRFYLSYHVYDVSGKLVAFDNPRFLLPQPVRPGADATFSIPAYFNLAAGIFIIEWDLVKEGEFWGRGKQWRSFFMDLQLQPLASAAFKDAWLPTFYESGRNWLDHEQYLLRQTLKNNEARKGDAFFGFSAGTSYPQAWIRDTATLMFYARFFYANAPLQGIVGLFLLKQGPDGEVCDWVDTAGRSDKNTVESDQESSLVLAAYPLALDDPGWLRLPVNGLSVFARLEKALDWLWQKRFDPEYGMIWSGFTADWGDVERSYADDRATKLSDRSRHVFSIYTQALYLQAGQKLIAMADWLNDKKCVERWRRRLQIIRRHCRQRLYLPEQGYFLIHLLAGPDDFLALEKGILAVGGNAEAMRAGLMSRPEIERFIRVLEDRKKQFALRSVSFTLLPPYPQDFFPHPLLSPWSYQNGGEWDWIGGRLVAALYQNGFRKKAEEYLREIVTKNIRDGNIFEWSDRAGNGQGASFYAGAAGVLGEAILAGHFGLEEDFERYSFSVGSDLFKLHVSKANDRFTAENSNLVTVDITSLSKKEICILTGSGRKNCVSKKGKNIISK
ncbi:MAG: hypothetical protein JXI33_09200 [Candidatus Aminicenantes bacterium]|nr:hypothetical protein [Candidatus Aminicenantes bacterium]